MAFLAAAALLAGGCCHCERRSVPDGRPADVVERWGIGPGRGACEIDFAFLPPQDIYAGQVREATGRMQMDPRGRLSGEFVVRTDSVNMGEPDLTTNVRNAAEMLRGGDYPDSAFRFADAVPSGSLAGGSSEARATLDGTFRLKGVEIPLAVPAMLRRVALEGGGSAVDLRAAFRLDGLRQRFGITGPGGEHDEAGDSVNITVHFVLVPAAGG